MQEVWWGQSGAAAGWEPGHPHGLLGTAGASRGWQLSCSEPRPRVLPSAKRDCQPRTPKEWVLAVGPHAWPWFCPLFLGRHQWGSPEAWERRQRRHRPHTPAQLDPTSWWQWAVLPAPSAVAAHPRVPPSPNSPGASACRGVIGKKPVSPGSVQPSFTAGIGASSGAGSYAPPAALCMG